MFISRASIAALAVTVWCGFAGIAFAQDPPVPDEAMSCDQIATQIAAWQRAQKDDKALRTTSGEKSAVPAGQGQTQRPNDRLQQLTQLNRTKQCGAGERRTR